MWEDEIYFDDDEAAMEAYRAAIKGGGNASDGNDNDDDDDFQPEAPTPAALNARSAASKARRAPAVSKGKQAAGGSRQRLAVTKPRKPRVTIATSSRSPSPASSLATPIAKQTDDEDETIDIDGDGDNISSLSAIPAPDIGALKVSDTQVSTAMDVDGGGEKTLREREQDIRARILLLEKEIAELEKKCGVEGSSADAASKASEVDMSEFKAPEWSVPIRANVMNFDWEKLASACQFDVILMDPPWQLASQAPTRGVAIAYQQLPDVCIESLPIQLLQTSGFIFIWVINNKYTKAFQLMKQWGYTYVDDIAWVKQTVNRRMAKGHGYYLQHAKETCLVGKKGADPPNLQKSVASDVIFSERRGQSQKPEELYEIIEELIPGGNYLEIFGRKNNLRDYWVTVGNEL
ncbi:hypothetical protein H4R27_000624 [Coemansia aciculifera]|uniref:mRNA m(6)A methyltransferase n=1 Tax=Coemansia pectinata TaxID=1052879 RepID=A0A9W8LDB6_9FUNG|nr:hypothetical protein GGI19_000888 [Coemansia pectinata]KAJ2875557.1 hypothetical protein GGH93_001505 [Coemansia aciculifera]KAJ2886491.1 hypothetical protein H4R27_000624 [Coemansia aciculifera]